ncbi:MAG: hypothetical protein NVS3B14_20880 [Ktedonobacteraceae bacterium]
MFISRLTSHAARKFGYTCYAFGHLALGALLVGVLLASCSNVFGGSQPTLTTSAQPADVSLAKLSWCGKSAMLFRDEGAAPTVTATTTSTTTPTAASSATPGGSPTATATTGAAPGTPTTVSDWSVVKAHLGFTVYLPATLPRATCLVSAQATIHDPTFGGSFLIGYLFPDHTSITFSEAPLTSQNATFQCSVSNSSSPQKSNPTPASTPRATASPTPTPLQLCSGARNTTNIVLSARRSIEYLQQFFNALQPNVPWIPVS